jgi:hypothetical protein
VDLYFGGELIGQAETELERGFAEVFDHDVGALACIPPSWEARERESGRPVRRYTSADGRAGLLLVRLDANPQPALASVREAVAAMGPVLDATADVRPQRLRLITGQDSDFLRNLLRGYRVHYRYPGGRMVAGVGRDLDGSTVAALVFGPADTYFTGERIAEQVISSVDVFTPSASPEA